ncbi:hypothetical protein pdam_00007825 [Pocillopora damicornis]|uniref:RNA helicase n=1 Tax=Pocillopora damicornis TaxID=46731 RepID=A0A3M6TXR6_POCDA|nr:hypothetical protein pdam_00007825 [Pocillopora damicornis]
MHVLVQHECIPQAILGMDIICQAKSGMGKTAVFVLATLQQLEQIDGQVSVLVMCHTRELAFQISKEYERFSKYMNNIKVSVFFGGISIKKDQQTLKTNCPHIVVGTPGRILALAREKSLNLKHIKHFILDECDKMLEQLDMRRDVQEVFRMTPHEKQVMMFSATLAKEIRPVCKKFMQDWVIHWLVLYSLCLGLFDDGCMFGLKKLRWFLVANVSLCLEVPLLLVTIPWFSEGMFVVKPSEVLIMKCSKLAQAGAAAITPSQLPHLMSVGFLSFKFPAPQAPMEVYVDDETKLTLHGLQQYYVKLKDQEKNRKLFDLLDVLEFNQVIIFVKSVQRCIALAQLLIEQNFPAICIHRGMEQEERLSRYKQFKDFSKRMLVATNLFGRGMDIERVNIVFNYDMPEDSDTYLHRVARAGRFGTKGLAITFVSDEKDAKILNEVQDRFEVNVGELPEEIDLSTYSRC